LIGDGAQEKSQKWKIKLLPSGQDDCDSVTNTWANAVDETNYKGIYGKEISSSNTSVASKGVCIYRE